MSAELGYRVYDKVEKCYSDKAFSIDQFGDCYVQDEEGYWEEIDEERYVVERCTGLKDKNDKKIYEGNIVEYSWDFCGEKRKNNYVVEWLSGKVEHYPYSVDSGFTLPDSVDGYMVIGNIHENPELIEKEE